MEGNNIEIVLAQQSKSAESILEPDEIRVAPPPRIERPYTGRGSKLIRVSGEMHASEMEVRGFLMIIATLTGSISYSAGLNPPGGFWQDTSNGHVAGTPILRDTFYTRYMVFLYFNATSFVMSILIVLLSSISDFNYSIRKMGIVVFAVILDIAGLMCAYIAGSYRDMNSSIYVIVLDILVILIAPVFWLRGATFISCM